MINNVWQLALFLYLLHERTHVLVTFQHYHVTTSHTVLRYRTVLETRPEVGL